VRAGPHDICEQKSVDDRAGGILGRMLPRRTQDAQGAVKELLSDLSDLETRELCLKALRQAYAGDRADFQISVPEDLIGQLTELLVQRRGWSIASHPTGSAEVARRDHSAVRYELRTLLEGRGPSGLLEFEAWFVRAGFAWPLGGSSDKLPDTLRLTQAGHRFLKRSEDHPFLPGFVGRLVSRSPGLPDDVVSLWNDARTCLDHGLMRPAIVLLGVAYEVAIEHVVQALVARSVLGKAAQDQNAAKRIAAVRGKIDALVPDKDDRCATHDAYAFADQLRRRRNDASHTAPTYGFEDREEVEELIVSAGRHTPNLWRLH
jgi:hypothetical protein